MAVDTRYILGLEAQEAAARAGRDFEEQDWPERKELPESTVSAPTLPEEMLPQAIRPWLVDVAERSSVPLEFPAAPAITTLGATIGRKIAIRPSSHDDFATVPNFWGAMVGRPGTMKSHHVAEATRPLRQLQAEAFDEYEKAKVQNEARLIQIDAEIAGVKSKITAATKSGKGDMDVLQAELQGRLEEKAEAVTSPRRYITSDPTVEKIGELLNENSNGIMLLRDEVSGWLRTLDRPGREGDREFYLEAWNGTGSFLVDRIGRGTLNIKALTISIFGGIQPGKLRSYIENALNESDGDDGLLQRFQILVWPDSLGQWKQVKRWPDNEARRQAYGVFRRLANLNPFDVGAQMDEFNDDGIPYLRFDDDAQEMFDVWRDELENRLRSNELADSPAFESHIAKYRSLIPALALTFHLVDWAEGGKGGPVSLEAVRLAAAWGEFLEAHARKIYAEELIADRLAATRLADKIEKGHVVDGNSIRDVYQNGWKGLSTSDKVRTAAEVLAKANWLRIEKVSTGGRPTEVLRLHPDFRGGSSE